MCKSLNINVKTTAAESPWSNGLCERHNAVLADMLTKTLEDGNCKLETALAWAVNAKNSLHNVHGFSPYQLVFGKNPKLPGVLVNKLPANQPPVGQQVASNLNAMHRARVAFMQSEASEKIRRALRHNTSSSLDTKYITGDIVYYKRNDCSRWRGPGKVLGQDGSQVLIRHGGVYVRVHPCRVMMAKAEDGEARKFTDPKRNDIEKIIEDTDSEEEVENASTFTQLVESSKVNVNDSDVVTTKEPVIRDDPKTRLPKKGSTIEFIPKGDDNWKTVHIINRAGKSTGKYKYFFNVRDNVEDKVMELDFENEVEQWREVPN